MDVRTYLAQRAMDSKSYEVAARLLKEILAVQPNAAAALNNLAWVAAEMNDPTALEYAERANKLAPNAAPIMDTLGWILVEKGDTSGVSNCFKKPSHWLLNMTVYESTWREL